MNYRLLLLLVFSISLSGKVHAQPYQCEHPAWVSVTPITDGEVSIICPAADKALGFLERFGLTPRRAIHITITEQAITGNGYSAYGSYDSRSDTIQLMSFESILQGPKSPQMYGEPFDAEHYAGAIAHEIAHAVVQHNLTAEPLSPGPQEYLAHSTQLGVMPEDRRRAIIDAMDVEPWTSGDAISEIYMAIKPGKFAVKSYLHLITSKDPRTFVDILLNAKWFYVYVP